MLKNRIASLCAAVVVAAFSGICYAGPREDCAEYATLGLPAQNGQLLCRKGFLLAHNPENKTPYWVIEHLTARKAKGDPAINRNNYKFKADPDLAVGERAELKDYSKSGYDRGHMAPAADMKWDGQAMAECFYLSNMVPQVGIGMNQGIWKDLEEKMREWAIRRGEIYIFTGPIYKKNQVRTIGHNRVAIPSALYKIAYDPEQMEALSFIMPNADLRSHTLAEYMVSVRDIEQETGLDFLSNLDKTAQDRIEAVAPESLWQ